MASTIALLAAAPLVCSFNVPGGTALRSGPLWVHLTLVLDMLLLDGGAVAGPPVHDDGSRLFHQRGCGAVRLTGLDM